MKIPNKEKIFGVFHGLTVTSYGAVVISLQIFIFLQVVFYPFTDYAHSLLVLGKSQRQNFVDNCPQTIKGCVSANFQVSDFTFEPVGPKWQAMGLAIKLDLKVQQGSKELAFQSAKDYLGRVSSRYVNVNITEVKS